MQVHERYLGRTLRCTTCRTEFVADPVGAVVELEPAQPDVGEEEPRRSRRLLPWLLLLVPLAALLWWLGQDQSGGFAASIFGVERTAGDLATLDAGEGLPVPVAFDSDSVKILVQAAAGDSAGLETLREEGRCLEVPAGTHVRILDLGGKTVGARVRILEGAWASRIVWVPASWIR